MHQVRAARSRRQLLARANRSAQPEQMLEMGQMGAARLQLQLPVPAMRSDPPEQMQESPRD